CGCRPAAGNNRLRFEYADKTYERGDEKERGGNAMHFASRVFLNADVSHVRLAMYPFQHASQVPARSELIKPFDSVRQKAPQRLFPSHWSQYLPDEETLDFARVGVG